MPIRYGFLFGLNRRKGRCIHGQGMKINRIEALLGLSSISTDCTEAVSKGIEGYLPEGSLPQQICLVQDHGSNEDVMEGRKQTGEDI